MAQLAERTPDKGEGDGSNPSGRIAAAGEACRGRGGVAWPLWRWFEGSVGK